MHGCSLQICAGCRCRRYCSKACQKADWKGGGHKQRCPRLATDASEGGAHDNSCIFAVKPWTGDKLVESCIDAAHQLYASATAFEQKRLTTPCVNVQTGCITISNDRIFTCGLNTCVFVAIRTQRGQLIGWHASSQNMVPGDEAMAEVDWLFASIKRNKDVERCFIVPGVDRAADMTLKPDCRQMREIPGTEPRESWTFYSGVLQRYNLLQHAEFLPPPGSYKDFIVFDRTHETPYTVHDPAAFDRNCGYDGERD